MSAETRDRFFQPQRERLEHMADRAVRKGLSREEFVAVAIDVDDPAWTEVVEALMPDVPGSHWQEFRDKGETPVARGTARAEVLIEYLSSVVPDITPALKSELPAGMVRAIVMADGGASVYYIEPIPHFQN
ncbi:MAG: hypothetical protein M1484_00205 [Patescibacteria group bacterium]|nr:hypothetical protein [Patescibacteria group bacterium]MCL5431503.1 hypothetical protein [Patescibacteria group bacterium]